MTALLCRECNLFLRTSLDTDRQTDRQTGRQTDMDRWVNGRADLQTDGLKDTAEVYIYLFIFKERKKGKNKEDDEETIRVISVPPTHMQ